MNRTMTADGVRGIVRVARPWQAFTGSHGQSCHPPLPAAPKSTAGRV